MTLGPPAVRLQISGRDDLEIMGTKSNPNPVALEVPMCFCFSRSSVPVVVLGLRT